MKKRNRIILYVVFCIGIAISIIGIFLNEYDNDVIENSEIAQLKKQYSFWFDLPSDNGLTVCVWQYPDDTVECGLLSGVYGEDSFLLYKSQEWYELSLHKGASIKEMKLILSTYKIPKEKINVVAWGSPASSHSMKIPSEELIADIKKEIIDYIK